MATKTPDGAHVVALPYDAAPPRELTATSAIAGDDFCLVVQDVFTPSECAAMIATTNALGYERALINVGGGEQVYRPDVRNCGRCMVDDARFAKEMMRRLLSFVPKTMEMEGEPLKLFKINPRMRFVAYAPGQFFRPHCDGNFYDESDDSVSIVTIQVYLDEGMVGGCSSGASGMSSRGREAITWRRCNCSSSRSRS